MVATAQAPTFANGSLDTGSPSGALPGALEQEIRAIYRRSPFYGRRFPLHTEQLGWSCYREIPPLTKIDIVRAGPCAFFEDCDEMNRRVEADDYERESTSGTTAGPMTVIMERGWWSAQTRRAYAATPLLEPFSRGSHRRAVLAPVNCSSHLCPYSDFPFPNRWIDDTIYLNLASDPFAFLESEWDRIVNELVAVKPVIVEGEPVYLSLLARALLRRHTSLPSVRALILTYGKASRIHGDRIAAAFPGVPQVDLYGSTEAGYLFVGPAFSPVHPIEDNAFIELARYDLHAPDGTQSPAVDGRPAFQILVTTRHREAMPLLRYHSGDLVTPAGDGAGDGWRILGRERDLWFRPDGRLLTSFDLDATIPADWPVWHFCLSQISPQRWQFEYVADEPAPAGLDGAVASAIDPSARVQLQRRKRLSPAASGKFPLFKPLPPARAA